MFPMTAFRRQTENSSRIRQLRRAGIQISGLLIKSCFKAVFGKTVRKNTVRNVFGRTFLICKIVVHS